MNISGYEDFRIEEDKADFHEFRKNAIGGSDVASILGLSKYTTPLEKYIEYTEGVDHEAATPLQYMGHVMEQPIIEWYKEKFCASNVEMQMRKIHDKHDFIRGNIDAYDADHKRIIEIKTTTSTSRYGSYTDCILPPDVLLQVYHYFSLMPEAKSAIVIVLYLQSGKISYQEIERNDMQIEQITNACVKFWEQNVVSKTPPPASSPDDYRLTCTNGEEKDSTPEIESLVRDIDKKKNEITFLTTQKKDLETQLKAEIGEFQTINLENGKKINYKVVERKTVDTVKLKKDLPEVYEKCTKVSKSRILYLPR